MCFEIQSTPINTFSIFTQLFRKPRYLVIDAENDEN